MNRFLSRFSPQYQRSLIYMLQASEYNIDDYFAWYRRVEDFRKVENRKQLVWTTKAKALNVLAWIFVGALTLFAINALFVFPFSYNIAAVVLITLVADYGLPYMLALCVWAGQVMQKPIEQKMIRQARETLRRHSAFKIAIAGSFGKTSMREILRTVLGEGKKVAAPGGSENTPLAIARFVEQLKGDEDILIFELGEYYPGDIKELCEMVQPALGIITGVNEAHLQKFHTLEAAADTIFELAEFVDAQDLYVNGDNETAHVRAKSGNVVYSSTGANSWKVENAETSLDGTHFDLVRNDGRLNVESKLLGVHQISALAAAAAIASRLGLSADQIQKGLAKTKPFAHRLERRDDGGVITLDDSYNGNPGGVKAVIDFLASIKGHPPDRTNSAVRAGRRWYVTPGLVEMGDRSEALHRDIGKQLAQADIEKVVLIRNSVTPWIEQGLKEAHFKGEIMWYDDALKCYAALPHETVAGDVVLLQNDWPDQYA